MSPASAWSYWLQSGSMLAAWVGSGAAVGSAWAVVTMMLTEVPVMAVGSEPPGPPRSSPPPETSWGMLEGSW